MPEEEANRRAYSQIVEDDEPGEENHYFEGRDKFKMREGQILESVLDHHEKLIADARETLEHGDPDAALSKLSQNLYALDFHVTAVDEDHYPEEITKRIEKLHEQCQVVHKQAQQALTTFPIPETIPSVERYSLTYDDIEKGDSVGRGGNAEVYHATAEADSRTIDFALKEPPISGTLHTETIERILEEAETWRQLDDHDHIVGIVDHGSEPLPWIAMEYMDAGHLGERAGEMDYEQALWTALVMTQAVRYAHKRAVAHLDLKPENVLFQSIEDAWDVPKVADWGLSKHLLAHSKSVEEMSPQYAAPEQFDSGEFGSVDNLTDVYQLGAVCYELFTGRPPFEVIKKIEREGPRPPSHIADIPPEIDDILLTALATHKGDRYEDVLYLRDELQDLLDSL